MLARSASSLPSPSESPSSGAGGPEIHEQWVLREVGEVDRVTGQRPGAILRSPVTYLLRSEVDALGPAYPRSRLFEYRPPGAHARRLPLKIPPPRVLGVPRCRQISRTDNVDGKHIPEAVTRGSAARPPGV